MFNFDFIYDSINLLLIWIMYYMGSYISKGKNYWECCLLVIITFTLIEGFRYGRGVDYMHYVDVYNHDLENKQVLFTSLNQFLKSLGVSPDYAFMVYALPFITGAVVMMKPLKEYAAYLFPLFLMSIISIHEAFIRQALAMSFVFIYISMLNSELDAILNKKIKISNLLWLMVFALIAYSIHSISIIAIFVVTALMIFVKKPLPWIYTVPLLVLGKFVISKSFDFSYLNSLLTFWGSSSDKFAGYTENADVWFSAEAMNDAYTRNIMIELLETFGCCALLYLGSKTLSCFQNTSYVDDENSISTVMDGSFRLILTLFNAFVVGIIILETFYNLEIVRRVAYSWSIFWFVPMSLILYYRKSQIFNTIDKFLMLGFTYWLWEYIRFLFVWKETPMFIWDK